MEYYFYFILDRTTWENVGQNVQNLLLHNVYPQKDEKANHRAHHNIWRTPMQSLIPMMLRTLLLSAWPKTPRQSNMKNSAWFIGKGTLLLEHVSGREQFISGFNDERDKQAQEEEQKGKKWKMDAQEGQVQSQPSEAGSESLFEALASETGRRTPKVWLAFSQVPPISPGFVRCTLKKMDGTICGTVIKHCDGTTNLRNHLTAQHKLKAHHQKRRL